MNQQVTRTTFPGGSEWRRWDLQVHTPLSALNNGFGQDFDAYAKILFERAVIEEIAVIGVTDYFTIDGYKRLRSLQQDSKRLTDLLGAELAASARRIRLLASVEFRLDDLVRVGEQDSRINAHVIFSDDVDPRDIEENFLHRLLFVSESEPANRDAAKPLTVANLAEFGARLKAEHAPFASRTDLEVGMSQATVSHGEISDVLSQNKAFKRRYLFVTVADEDLSRISWDGQGHSTRKVLIQKSHMLFSASPGTRAFALGQKAGSVASFEAEFRGRKPCIHGSDAHSAEGLFVFAEGRRLWVCADPTFDGLVQLCHEPEDRVYIGPEPPALQRIRASATKSIEAISFQRDAAAGANAEWFSGSVPLNAGMVAVIGKKGSGKSALADVIGLLGEAQTTEDFSFLTPDRFLNPRSDLGRRFEATLRWRSGDSETRKLDASCDPSLPERVRHIPQNYLEKICAEIQESSTPTLFDRELEAVIFSHVPRADRVHNNRGHAKPAEVVQARSRLPAYCTSIGKVLLAYLPERLQERLITEMDLTKRGPRTMTSKTALRAQLEDVQQEGLAINDEELRAGSVAIAAPVREESGDVVAAVGLAACGGVVDADELVSRFEGKLVATAERISRQLGWRGEEE